MIRRTAGRSAPFSRYNGVARKPPLTTAAARPGAMATPIPQQATAQQAPIGNRPIEGRKGGERFQAPELRGLRNRPPGSVPIGGGIGEQVRDTMSGMLTQIDNPQGQPPVDPQIPDPQIYRPPTEEVAGNVPGDVAVQEETGWLENQPETGTEEYQQGMYNLAREQQSGQTAADVEYARTQLGSAGLRAGESGIATRALMNIRRGGSEALGQRSKELAMQGMGARYGQQQDLMNMIMQKYGIDTAAQQRRFDPYYSSEQQYAGRA